MNNGVTRTKLETKQKLSHKININKTISKE